MNCGCDSKFDICNKCLYSTRVTDNMEYIIHIISNEGIWYYDDINRVLHITIDGDLLCRVIKEEIPEIVTLHALTFETNDGWQGALYISGFSIQEIEDLVKKHFK